MEGGNEKMWIGKGEKEEMIDGIKRDRYKQTEKKIFIKGSMQILES